MSASADRPIPRSVGAEFIPYLTLSLLFCFSSGLTQNASHASPRYGLQSSVDRKIRCDPWREKS
jgi:hypothetical protein